MDSSDSTSWIFDKARLFWSLVGSVREVKDRDLARNESIKIPAFAGIDVNVL